MKEEEIKIVAGNEQQWILSWRIIFRKNLWYIPFLFLSLQRSPGKALSQIIRCW